ncbi:MAG: diaminobutyrate acetyltransferase [Dehalococcoidia bacterium]|nr:diaminobutyrate acetyltransferase [Dehalococcoidia bacterium]
MTLMRVGTSIDDPAPDEQSPTNEEADEESTLPRIRPPRLEYGDGAAMWRLARESGVLEENAEYTYHMFSHFFADACVIAEIEGKPAGFIAGFRPPDRPDAVFVWQIAVHPDHRGQGIARLMLHGLLQRLHPEVQFLEATVAPSNKASERTFRSVARELDTLCNEAVLFPADRFGGPSHEDEVLFRIGPVTAEAAAAYAPRMEQETAAAL